MTVWKQPKNKLAVRTQNIRAFQFDPRVLGSSSMLTVDDQQLGKLDHMNRNMVFLSRRFGEWEFEQQVVSV